MWPEHEPRCLIEPPDTYLDPDPGEPDPDEQLAALEDFMENTSED